MKYREPSEIKKGTGFVLTILLFIFSSWLHPSGQASPQALIDDFQVNQISGGNILENQYYSSVAVNGKGDFIIVWEDERYGDKDIYARCYDSAGIALGPSFRVNDDNTNEDQSLPFIAVDGKGNFVIVWIDRRNNGIFDIYAQRYDASGTPLGANFMVNDDSGCAGRYSEPSLAMNDAGNFVIVWHDRRNGVNIYAQRYDSNGTALGANFKVNDDTSENVTHWSPDVALDGTGNFVIAWHDWRNGNSDIYAQRYDSNGTALGANFKVNDDSMDAWQKVPAIAMDGDGNFVVAWHDCRNNDWDIYAQRYDASGTALGTNFKINDDSVLVEQSFPAIAMDSPGNFVVAWHDYRNGDWDIYAQRYDAEGTALGANFKVNTDSTFKDQFLPSTAMDEAGNFIVTWHDWRNGNWDVYAQRYMSDGTVIGDNFKVNDDIPVADQWSPHIAVDNSGNFIIAWVDRCNINDDIYAQRFDASGRALGTNFIVNDDSGSANEYSNPHIFLDGANNFLIVWEDERYGKNIYGQRYDAAGSPLGANFKIKDGMDYPSMAMDKAGNFLMVWSEAPEDGSFWNPDGGDILACRYDASGTAVGEIFKVSDDTLGRAQSDPSIAMDRSGNFIIVWEDTHYEYYWDILAQRYDASGTALGANFKVNDDTLGASQYDPTVVMDEAGNCLVVWKDKRNGDEEVYAQRYDVSGAPIGANFKLKDGSYNAIAMDSLGNFIIVWDEYLNDDWNVYAQRFDAEGTPIDTAFIFTQIKKGFQKSPDVRLWNGRIYNTWTSNQVRGVDYDIWANVLDWNNPTDIEFKTTPIVNSLQLFQNYPNPFNPNTTIKFRLPAVQMTSLTIYNVLGQKVRTLVNQRISAGVHSVQWDGRNDLGQAVSSGVYLYRLQVGQTVQTKKMLLVR